MAEGYAEGLRSTCRNKQISGPSPELHKPSRLWASNLNCELRSNSTLNLDCISSPVYRLGV